MKSLALSLLLAVGLTLGSQAALADAPPRAGANLTTASAQESMKLASQHAQAALAHREAARKDAAMAIHAHKIADDDLKQGFTYEAGVERAKARQYEASARNHTAAAEREEATALFYRKLAAQQIAAQRPALKAVPRG